MPTTSRRGFTLIELLVVMTILVILVLIALPVFSYITAARSTESGVNLASAMLGRARALALSRTDNKYIGVLFYHQADDDRDAMQIVEVDADDTGSDLERYFSWQDTAVYNPLDNAATPPHPADVVYAQALDLTMGGASSPFNKRPVVKRYVCYAPGTSGTSADNRPPNGPEFVNSRWQNKTNGNTVPVALDAEVQFLPLGVRARVLKRDNGSILANPGLVLFDKQGHVTKRRWLIGGDDGDASIDGGEKLLEAMGLDKLGTANASGGIGGMSGIGLSIFNIDDVQRADASIDPKNVTAVNKWVETNVDQYTVGTQSGELIAGGR